MSLADDPVALQPSMQFLGEVLSLFYRDVDGSGAKCARQLGRAERTGQLIAIDGQFEALIAVLIEPLRIRRPFAGRRLGQCRQKQTEQCQGGSHRLSDDQTTEKFLPYSMRLGKLKHNDRIP